MSDYSHLVLDILSEAVQSEDGHLFVSETEDHSTTVPLKTREAKENSSGGRLPIQIIE